ncbi:MAG TPA: DUF4301 family protein, partial [Thermoanaerobaculia bacterium]|nr:DUF4301 family protein [Thermoanaerobaculia bacterium]
MFTPRDHGQLEARGVDPAVAARQVELLRNPPRPIALARPATRGDGIRRIAAPDYAPLESAAAAAANAGRLMAFVPASGAATRMFKDLRAALESAAPGETEAGRRFFESIDAFPFAGELRARAGSLDTPTPEQQKRILEALLDGMNYADTPKGLIPFHRAGDGVRTPFEEHLLQARRYLRAADGTVRAHFTVAAEHVADFERALETIRPRIENDGSRLDVGFSVQHRATDAIALDPSGEPFRTSDGSLLLRPSGHGALLRNLEAADAEIVSIRNIDNVVRDEASEEVVRWKRILIGALVRLQNEIFAILGEIDRGAGEPALDRAIGLARESFVRVPEAPLRSVEEKRAFVRAALDRPLRVCGVVLNEGEPGGAPFWVAGPGGATLQ